MALVPRRPFWSLALAAAFPAALATQPVFRAGVEMVHLGVTVVDRTGALVADLGPGDFEVVEAGRPQKVEVFARGSERGGRPPLHVGLLLDTSASMADDAAFSRSAAIKFLNRVDWAEDITLVDFATEVRVTRFGQSDFARLVERIRNRRPDGDTALYDALGVYLDGSADQAGEKVLVLYTDGADTRSILTFAEALDLLRAADVTLYVIGFLERQSTTVRYQQRLLMAQLAEATGGLAFFPLSTKQLDEMYDLVLREMNARYVLGYVSSDPARDGAWRRVEVRLTRPDLKGAKVRARKGYFAPYREPAGRP